MQEIRHSDTRQRMPTVAASGPVQVIQDLVRTYYDLSARELKGSSRVRRISWPRQVAMALIRQRTNFSLPDIGKCFGGRDHTTVMHALQAVETRCRNDRKCKADFAEIDRRVDLALGLAYVRRQDILGKQFVSSRRKGGVQ